MKKNNNTLNSLTPKQQEDLKFINEYINKAVKSWVDNNNSRGRIPDDSDYWYDEALKICKKYNNGDIEFDFPGLYPTFEITINNTHYCEYSTENMFKRINNYWNNND